MTVVTLTMRCGRLGFRVQLMRRALTFWPRFVGCHFLTRDMAVVCYFHPVQVLIYFVIETRQELDAAMDEETRRKRQLKRKIIKQKQKVRSTVAVFVILFMSFVELRALSLLFLWGIVPVNDHFDFLTSQLRKRLLLNAGGGVDGDGEPDMFELRDIKSSAALQTVEESMTH